MNVGSATSVSEETARARILDATIEVIDRRGEAAVRLVEVARAAGVTQGMISYYFDGREGLVIEAQRRRFIGAATEDARTMRDVVSGASDATEFYSELEKVTRAVVGIHRAANRATRVSALGAALGRPDLQAEFAEVQATLVDDLTEVVELAQRRGFVRRDLSPRAVASFFIAYSIGMVIADVDPRRPDDEDLVQMIMIWLDGLLVDGRAEVLDSM